MVSIPAISIPNPERPTKVIGRDDGQEADRVDAKVFQDLRAEADLAPLPRARLAGRRVARFRDGDDGHARGAVAQQHEHASAFGLETRQRLVNCFRAAEHVGDDVGAMQPRQHILAVADAAENEGHVIDRVERREKGVAGQRADLRLHRKLAGALDQLVARLPVGNELRDGDAHEPMAFGEFGELRPVHHGAVVVHHLGEHADRRQSGEAAEIDAGLGMA